MSEYRCLLIRTTKVYSMEDLGIHYKFVESGMVSFRLARNMTSGGNDPYPVSFLL